MDNPFESKAIKFATQEELNHLAELAKSYGLEVENVKMNKICICEHFRLNGAGYYTNSTQNKYLPEITYSDFIASLQPMQRNHTKQQPDIQSAPGHTILDTAKGLIYGDREKDYGKTVDNFNAIAVGWTEIAKTLLTPEQVALMMIWLKVCRANNDNCEKEDSIIDICGYAGCIEKIKKGL
jgi:hypothetical protein